jgi:hypothetical protein
MYRLYLQIYFSIATWMKNDGEDDYPDDEKEGDEKQEEEEGKDRVLLLSLMTKMTRTTQGGAI